MLDSTILKSNCLVISNVQAYYHENKLAKSRYEVNKLGTHLYCTSFTIDHLYRIRTCVNNEPGHF